MSTSTTTTTTTSRPRSQFIQKLLKIVQAQEGIVWNVNGDQILIQNPKSFSKEVLPRYFRSGNYASFVRQLHFYGFHKVDKTQDMFQHVKFRRDHPELARDIVRRTNGVANDCNDKAMRTQVLALTEELTAVKSQVGNMTNQIDSLSVLLKELYTDRNEMKKQMQEQKQYTQRLERIILEKETALSFSKPVMSLSMSPTSTSTTTALGPYSPSTQTQRPSDSKKRKRNRDQPFWVQVPKAITRSISSGSETEDSWTASATEDEGDIFFLEDMVDGGGGGLGSQEDIDLDFDLTDLMPPIGLTREGSLKLTDRPNNSNNANASSSALDEFTKNWPMEDIVKPRGNGNVQVELELEEEEEEVVESQRNNDSASASSCSSSSMACADAQPDAAKFEQYKSCVQAFILAQLTSAQNTCNALTTPTAVMAGAGAGAGPCHSSGGFSETCCDVIDIIAEKGKASQNQNQNTHAAQLQRVAANNNNNNASASNASNASLSSITPAQMAQLSSVLVAALAPAMLECCKKKKATAACGGTC